MKTYEQKNIAQKVKEIKERLSQGGYFTEEDKLNFEIFQDPVFLSQGINMELYDLNVTASKIFIALKWGLVCIGIILLYIAIK